MKFTKNQIKEILAIKKTLEMVNTLSRVYIDLDNKKINNEILNDRYYIYNIYCSFLYNLVEAIEKSKFYFESSEIYNKFNKIINEEYKTNELNYFIKNNYKTNLFTILREVRHCNNHYKKEENDETLLLDIEIDFEKLENLRIVINEMFYDVYNTIDKNTIKEIIFSTKKIKYSNDKFEEKTNEFVSKTKEIIEASNGVFENENKELLRIFEKTFNLDNLYALSCKEKNAIDEYEVDCNKVMEFVDKAKIQIDTYCNEEQKDIFYSFVDFINKNDGLSKNEYINFFESINEKINNINQGD